LADPFLALPPKLAALPAAPWVLGLAGVALLAFGRRILWLGVGLTGFFAGLTLAFRLLEGAEGMVVLVVGLIAGLVGLGLAFFLQRLAIVLLGFLLGAWLASTFGAQLAQTTLAPWMLLLLGGLAGAVLAGWLYEGAVTLVTVLLGAALVAQALPVSEGTRVVALLFLVPFGFLIQLYKRPPKTE
jgi:hypothetical protein